jgi:hypothetical protein
LPEQRNEVLQLLSAHAVHVAQAGAEDGEGEFAGQRPVGIELAAVASTAGNAVGTGYPSGVPRAATWLLNLSSHLQ